MSAGPLLAGLPAGRLLSLDGTLSAQASLRAEGDVWCAGGFGVLPSPRIAATSAETSVVFIAAKLASVCSAPFTTALRAFFAVAAILVSLLPAAPSGRPD